MKDWKSKIWNVINPIIRILSTLISIFLFIWLFRYLGFKGFIGLLIGMFIMAFLILSKNMLLLSIVRLFDGDDYLNEINKTKQTDNKEETIKES